MLPNLTWLKSSQCTAYLIGVCVLLPDFGEVEGEYKLDQQQGGLQEGAAVGKEDKTLN